MSHIRKDEESEIIPMVDGVDVTKFKLFNVCETCENYRLKQKSRLMQSDQ